MSRLLLLPGFVLMAVGALGMLLSSGGGEAPVAPASGDTLRQIDPQNPCGVVCVLAAAQVLEHPLEPSQVHQAIPADGLGRTSMTDLVAGFRRLGFSAAGVSLTPRHLARLPPPVILYVERSHFVVALPGNDETVVMIDPPEPVRSVRLSDLGGKWDGEAIIVQRTAIDLQRTLRLLGLSAASASPEE